MTGIGSAPMLSHNSNADILVPATEKSFPRRNACCPVDRADDIVILLAALGSSTVMSIVILCEIFIGKKQCDDKLMTTHTIQKLMVFKDAQFVSGEEAWFTM